MTDLNENRTAASSLVL